MGEDRGPCFCESSRAVINCKGEEIFLGLPMGGSTRSLNDDYIC